MFVLDTNHVRELLVKTSLGDHLRHKVMSIDDDVYVTVISVEEANRGWLAKIQSTREVEKQVFYYKQLDQLVTFFARHERLLWDVEAAARFQQLRQQGVRVGTMDLKIACIALEYDATLVTRNTVDFAKIPGLRIENWL